MVGIRMYIMIEEILGVTFSEEPEYYWQKIQQVDYHITERGQGSTY